nr:DUF5618 family protein [uncultured Dyadobacter sp.]
MRDALKKARLYVDEARSIIKGLVQEDGYYTEPKEIKRAGRRAYKGVMIAVNNFFGLATKNEQSISWYERKFAELDSIQSCRFYSAYCLLYLSMGYDGSLIPLMSSEGLKEADELINWIEFAKRPESAEVMINK